MDHHEQHHQRHEKERQERIRHEKQFERGEEKQPWKIHPAWFGVVGVVLVLIAVLLWTFVLR